MLLNDRTACHGQQGEAQRGSDGSLSHHGSGRCGFPQGYAILGNEDLERVRNYEWKR